MNDFERRLLDIYTNSSWIAAVARQNRQVIGIDYFVYNVGPSQGLSQVASTASATGTIQIQSDSDFAITYMSGNQVVNNAVVTNPISTIQITDTGTGKTFFSSASLFGLVMGSSGTPFYLPQPRVVAPNTNLNFAITNVFSAAAADYYISLTGARIYYAG